MSRSMEARLAALREKYGAGANEAITLAKINWEWLSTVNFAAPKGHKWLKFGLWEFDEKTGCYQNVVWGDMLLDKKNLPKKETQKKGTAAKNGTDTPKNEAA